MPRARKILASAAALLFLVAMTSVSALAEQAQPEIYDRTTGLLKSKPQYDPTTGLSRQTKPEFNPTTGMPTIKTPRFDPTTGLSTDTGVVVEPTRPGGPPSLDPNQAARLKMITVKVYSASGHSVQAVVKAEGDGVDFNASCQTIGGSCRFAVPCCPTVGQAVIYRFTAQSKGRQGSATAVVTCGAECGFPIAVNLRLPAKPLAAVPTATTTSPTATPSSSAKTRPTATTLKRYTTGGSDDKKPKPKRYSPDWRPWSK